MKAAPAYNRHVPTSAKYSPFPSTIIVPRDTGSAKVGTEKFLLENTHTSVAEQSFHHMPLPMNCSAGEPPASTPQLGKKKHLCDFFLSTDTLGLHLSEHCKDGHSVHRSLRRISRTKPVPQNTLESQMLAVGS